MGTLKPQSNGPSSCVGCYIWTVQRGGAWAGCGLTQSPLCYTKRNNPPIIGQCIPISYYSMRHYIYLRALKG